MFILFGLIIFWDFDEGFDGKLLIINDIVFKVNVGYIFYIYVLYKCYLTWVI